MSTAISVVQRNEMTMDIIQWDGSQEAADWITDRFGDQASFEGEAPDLSLKFNGTWPIDVGYWVLDQWGSPAPMPAENLVNYRLPAPPIDVPALPTAPTAPADATTPDATTPDATSPDATSPDATPPADDAAPPADDTSTPPADAPAPDPAPADQAAEAGDTQPPS
jgi:hypothetical protein